MAKIVRKDWKTSIDCRLMAARNREAIDEMNAWINRRRTARRARRRLLARLFGRGR